MKEIQLITKYIDENWHYEDYEVSPGRSASELLALWGTKDFSYGFYKQNGEEWVIHDDTTREVVKVIDGTVVHLRFE